MTITDEGISKIIKDILEFINGAETDLDAIAACDMLEQFISGVAQQRRQVYLDALRGEG